MQANRHKYLLLNWPFLIALSLLFLNDQFFKWQYGNWFTGKLSDAAGLFAFPFFIAFIFPGSKNKAAFITGLLFVVWKLPVSDGIIEAAHRYSYLPLARVKDTTDFIALPVLLLSHRLVCHIDQYSSFQLRSTYINPLILLLPASIVFMATSMPLTYFMNRPDGDIYIGKWYKLDMNKDSVLAKMRAEGFTVIPDTAYMDDRKMNGRFFYIKDVLLDGGKDTIPFIKIGLLDIKQGKGTKLLVNSIRFNGKRTISDWRELKSFSRHYEKLIKTGVIKEMKE